jgi:hypothetical protein
MLLRDSADANHAGPRRVYSIAEDSGAAAASQIARY